MKKLICRLTAVLLALGSLASNAATELQQYVQQCQNELHFNASDVPALNCNDGERFAFGAQNKINDFLVYKRVNDTVDLAVACRWLDGGTSDSGPKPLATSIELIIHNRQNAETCFFSAKETNAINPNTGTSDPIHPVSTAIVSPTNFGSTHPNADDYWLSPTDLNNKQLISTANDNPHPDGFTESARCVGCHVAGPYIASPRIIPYLAQVGLINNRHDTIADSGNSSRHYHVVGSSGTAPYNNLPTMTAFQSWDSTIASNIVLQQSECSNGCHSIGDHSTIGTLLFPADPNPSDTLLPSIYSVIGEIRAANPSIMPPDDPESSYRWINLDTPGDGVETENFADAKNPSTPPPVPALLQGCVAPSAMEARAIVDVGIPANIPAIDGIDYAFNTTDMSQIPDRLKTFNLKEGLVCLNSDQEQGHQCSNYSIRYLCSVQHVTGDVTWSQWYNMDTPTGDGDHEERSQDQNICGGVTPIAIQAQVTVNGNTLYVMGPNDRLARFSRYGLTCYNTDQVDGKCSNYMVRYLGCQSFPPPAFSGTLTNVYAVGKQVTAASGSLAKGQGHNNTWNTQQWNVEPVTNTEYVRVHNVPTNVYLTVTSTAEQATVGTATSNTSTNEMWTIETIAGSTNVRLKNLFSGKYLTIADPKNFTSTPDYLPIYSQGLNTGWTSQLWIIQ